MITSQLNHKQERPNTYEVFSGVSLTVPDQSLSIREILRRSGVIDSGKSIYYDENPDHDNVDPTQNGNFDYADAVAISQTLAERRSERKAKARADKEVTERSAVDDARAKAEQEASLSSANNRNAAQ